MRFSAPASHIHRLISTFLYDFLPWYFLWQPLEILKNYLQYAKTFSQVFSILFLLKTLVSPWKSIAGRYPDNMLDIKSMLLTWTMNCTARSVGFMVRIITIFLALIIQLILLIFFAAYLAMWLLFPLFIIIGLRILTLLSIA